MMHARTAATKYETLNTDSRSRSRHSSLRDARREARYQGFRYAGEVYTDPNGRTVLPLYRTLAEARAFDDFAAAVLVSWI
jgi:hypothetical protein